MYFEKFNRGLYEFNINGTETSIGVVDITKNVRILKEVLSNITLYDEYDVKDGETPEIIAEKVYGNALYHWVILLVNERYDGILDFPQPDRVIDQLIIDKYGVENIDGIHHYVKEVDGKFYEVSSDVAGATVVTNKDYEYTLNESKRRIKLISPTLVSQVLKEYNDL